MDKYAKNEQRRLLWWKNEARRQEQRGAENFSAIEIAPKISQITGLYCSKIRTFTQGPGARCPSIMITEMVMKIVITIIIIITILTTMIIMMKCSQGEGGPWLAIGELVALYTRPTCDPGPWPLLVKCWRRKIQINSCKLRPVNQVGGDIYSKRKLRLLAGF